jgi:hypothetical protein
MEGSVEGVICTRSRNLPGRTKENHVKPVRIADIQGEIRTLGPPDKRASSLSDSEVRYDRLIGVMCTNKGGVVLQNLACRNKIRKVVSLHLQDPEEYLSLYVTCFP